MRPIFCELLSIEELAAKGFKEHPEGGLFIGSARYPAAKIKKSLLPLLGDKHEIIDFSETDWGQHLAVYIRDSEGDRIEVPTAAMREKIGKIKGLKVHKTIVGKSVATFNGFSFKFPCDTSRLPANEATKLAKWGLEMTK